MGFDKKDHSLHMDYLQATLHPIVLVSPFNSRCFDKPRDYPGDYLAMEMIYSDPLQGETAFAQLLNLHSLTLPMAIGVRQRCVDIKKMILETLKEKPRTTFLSVGSGPAREVREVLEELDGCTAEFYLLDQDEEALEYTREKLSEYSNVKFIHKDIKDLIKTGLEMKFDFVYCLGVSDYLSRFYAKRFIRSLYKLLEPKGRLVVGNANHNPIKIWMEHGSDWHLIYRDAKALKELAQEFETKGDNICIRECDEVSHSFLNLVLDK